MFKYTTAFSSFSVIDLAGAKEFYGNKLGLPISEEPEGLKLTPEGGTTIFIYAKADHSPASFTVLNFVVEDIQQAVEKLSALGIRFEHYGKGELETDSKGIAHTSGPKIAWFKDPAGNFLSVIEEKE